MKIRTLLFACAIHLSTPGLAATFEVLQDGSQWLEMQISQSYVMGDNDSPAESRHIALMQAKQAAAEKAGSYVQTERIVDMTSSSLNERLTTLSSALMKTEIVSEKINIDGKTGRPVMELVINARLDKNSVMDRMGVIRRDKQKSRLIADLEAENNALKRELAGLNRSIEKDNSRFLTDRRTDVLSELHDIERKALEVASKGSLLALATASDMELDVAKRRVKYDVLQAMAEKIQISLGQPTFEEVDDGYDLKIPFSTYISKPDLASIERVLWKEFRVQCKDRRDAIRCPITIKRYDDVSPLFKWLINEGVFVEMSLGKQVLRYPLAFFPKCLYSSRSECKVSNRENSLLNKDEYYIKLAARENTDNHYLVFKGVSRQTLANQNVEARLVVAPLLSLTREQREALDDIHLY